MSLRKKPKAKRPQYRIEKLNGVTYANEIAAMLSEFSGDAGSRATTFIGVTWWGAFEKSSGQLVGVAGMLQSAIEDDTFYLNRSRVSPEHRGYGLQRRLIKARVDRARELGGEYATSDTYMNPPSTNNLIACGFKAYQPKDPWRGEGTVYWRLKL